VMKYAKNSNGKIPIQLLKCSCLDNSR